MVLLLQRLKMFVAMAVRICADSVCTNRGLTTVPPQTGEETTETVLQESSENYLLQNKKQ